MENHYSSSAFAHLDCSPSTLLCASRSDDIYRHASAIRRLATPQAVLLALLGAEREQNFAEVQLHSRPLHAPFDGLQRQPIDCHSAMR
ncbi:hypothetical protein AC578_10566 [Pseudocercospora eumusae]|uniref:Uncharacterized protein n=1 Tax=Pseudocercospora eumusae TaxID=321146 RepID=A0A139H5D0_9PEZI|nr:hypothetical protein AC578_10566 [Pseudocercospora eumusae]